MKIYTIKKIGYSAGVYGNSGEYFILFIIKGNSYRSMAFVGKYGPEYRVSEALKKRGFTELYFHGGTYGKMSIREDKRFFTSERDTLNTINAKDFYKSFNDIKGV